MSEIPDAEREVEDFFNEEILGVRSEEENPAPFPAEAPPEPKPADEVVIDTPPEEEQPAEEEAEPEPEPEPSEEEATDELVGEPDLEAEPELEEPEPGEPEYIAWAKKKYGDLDAEKLAKAAYEQEKMIGRQAEEARQRELQERIDALNTPGVLTQEEDNWVDEAVVAGDPGQYAYDALQAGRPDLYAAVMDRWSAQGEQESRMARILHSRVMQAVSQPLPSEQESYSAALGQTFLSLGLDIEQHGPLILSKAEELGAVHPAVQGMMSADDDVRRIATRAIYDLVAAGRSTVQKAKSDDVVGARVKEEQLRQQASGVNAGGPRVEQPKKSAFWETFDEELAERGWDGNRPAYGRD